MRYCITSELLKRHSKTTYTDMPFAQNVLSITFYLLYTWGVCISKYFICRRNFNELGNTYD